MVDQGFVVPKAPEVSSLAAHDACVDSGAMTFLLMIIGTIEAFSYAAIAEMMLGETDREPGDYKFDAFGFLDKSNPTYSDARAARYRNIELEHCRAAMLGFSGMVTASAMYEHPFPYY